MNEFPYELNLALTGILGGKEQDLLYENQLILLKLYTINKLTLEEIQKWFESGSGLVEGCLRELQDALMVESFYEDQIDEYHHFYALTTFGRRIIDALFDALLIVVTRPRGDENEN